MGPPLKPSKPIDGVAASLPLSSNLLWGSSNKGTQFVAAMAPLFTNGDFLLTYTVLSVFYESL